MCFACLATRQCLDPRNLVDDDGVCEGSFAGRAGPCLRHGGCRAFGQLPLLAVPWLHRPCFGGCWLFLCSSPLSANVRDSSRLCGGVGGFVRHLVGSGQLPTVGRRAAVGLLRLLEHLCLLEPRDPLFSQCLSFGASLLSPMPLKLRRKSSSACFSWGGCAAELALFR